MLRKRLLPRCFTADDELQRLGEAPRREIGPVIRLLVWNIYKAKHRRWQRDFNELVADRDLVMLQEAVINAPSDAFFIDGTAHEWVMARSHEHPRSGVITGVKTGSLVTSIDSHFYLSPHTEPIVNTQKLLLVTRYPLVAERETLLVLNMHAINFVSVQKYIEQLDQLTAALAGHAGPVILAGDFNTWNPKRLGHFMDISREAGLEEAAMERQSRLAHLNQHLDHVFYRGLRLRSVESLSYIPSSDHAPITATFVRERALHD